MCINKNKWHMSTIKSTNLFALDNIVIIIILNKSIWNMSTLRTSPIMNLVGFQVWTQYYWHHHNSPTLLPFLKNQKIIKTTYKCTSIYRVAFVSKRQCFQRIMNFVYLYGRYFWHCLHHPTKMPLALTQFQPHKID
jgi:hypothetical protein